MHLAAILVLSYVESEAGSRISDQRTGRVPVAHGTVSLWSKLSEQRFDMIHKQSDIMVPWTSALNSTFEPWGSQGNAGRKKETAERMQF